MIVFLDGVAACVNSVVSLEAFLAFSQSTGVGFGERILISLDWRRLRLVLGDAAASGMRGT